MNFLCHVNWRYCLIFLLFFNFYNLRAQSDLLLWYKQAAKNWNEALPIGNGRLGAMVYGGVQKDIIQLNEESLVGGSNFDNTNPQAGQHIDEIRRLLLAGDNDKAHELAKQYLLATPADFRSYQTLGNIYLDFAHEGPVASYRRSLNLEEAISEVSYSVNGVRYKREYFISAPQNVMVIRLSSDKARGLSFKATLSRQYDATVQAEGQGMLLMQGQLVDLPSESMGPGGLHMKFAAALRIIPQGGEMHSLNNTVIVTDADEALLIFTAATDYDLSQLNFNRDIDPYDISKKLIRQAESYSFERLKQNHLADYQPYFKRVSLHLGNEDNQNLPTDVRLQRVKEGKADLGLVSLYFQYGRYLLLSSSRAPGVLPANLQGIWNEHFEAPWKSDYHTNINVQMNYWPADVTNLSETVRPYVEFVDRLRVPGRITAQKMYKAKGWTIHHATDIFGKSGIISGIHWGTSPLSGVWLCLNLWENYLFTQDKQYLKDKIYPIMREAAEYVESFLIEAPNGYLVTAPSMSPENSFRLANGKAEQLTYAPTIDNQLITAFYQACIHAGNIVGEDPQFLKQLKATLKRIPPTKVSQKYGIVQEWIADYEEVEPGHRHMSQLVGLYPANLITPATPELFEAARHTLTRRLTHGGGHTGWSRAWIINFYARLLDGEEAWKNVQDLLAKSTLNNLFDTHPPFQIDGNFGGTAGIAEMLLQSHEGIIHVLPAVPEAWNEGAYSGLVARGAFEVSVSWKAGKLEKLLLHSRNGGEAVVQYKGKKIKVKTNKNQTYDLSNRF